MEKLKRLKQEIANKIYQIYQLIKVKFQDSINLSKTMRNLGNWDVKWYLTSVDITGIYNNQFNSKRYFLNCFHMVLLTIEGFCAILFACNDSVWKLVDNEFMPKRIKNLIICGIAIGFMVISLRFDIVSDEWYNHLKMFKFAYYMQENIPSKHGLTKRNHFKLSLFTKILEVFLVKIYTPIFFVTVVYIYLYITIKSNNFLLQLLFPFIIYIALMLISTISLIFLICFIIAYYYKLLFDQINHKIETIYKRSTKLLKIVYQKRLVRLMKRHDVFASQMYQMNLFIRRSAMFYFIVITLIQINVLNLYFDSNSSSYKAFYLICLCGSITFGFGIVFLSSLQIDAAHKSAKLIRKILYKNKKKLNFNFKWKVIYLISIY